jgi:2-polyprenyl-3-methyl-5-hydroxy-6-metoxy-1,4-benzoquinol methylase
LQHRAFTILLDDHLALAPVEDAKRVLDIATGTGIWAIQFAQQHPNAEVVGTDLSAIQPVGLVPNCSFVVENAEADNWTKVTQTFDYIHMRAVVGGLASPEKVARHCFEHLEPGGWVEFQDPEMKVRSPDGSHIGMCLLE